MVIASLKHCNSFDPTTCMSAVAFTACPHSCVRLCIRVCQALSGVCVSDTCWAHVRRVCLSVRRVSATCQACVPECQARVKRVSGTCQACVRHVYLSVRQVYLSVRHMSGMCA